MSDSPPASSPPEASKKQKRKNKNRKKNDNEDKTSPSLTAQTTNAPAIPPPLEPMTPPTRLLVASIGNPAPYLSTLHSAGHTVLSSLASSINGSSFTKSRVYGNGLISHVPAFTPSSSLTLWQSPTLMNVSGPAVATAWRAFVREQGGGEAELGLVVVHDELEGAVGTVRVRPGTASAKGHNGLKSVGEAMRGMAYARIGVGIGRPTSREPEVVARWCLRRMTEGEREKVVGCVGRVEEELRRMVGG